MLPYPHPFYMLTAIVRICSVYLNLYSEINGLVIHVKATNFVY